MPGMHSGLTDTNQVLVSAFKTALLHQGELALLIFTLLAIAWVASREFLRAGTVGARMLRSRAGLDAQPEPAGGACCGSGSASSGSSTACCKGSQRCQPGCRVRSSRPPQPALLAGSRRGELGRHRLVLSPGAGGHGRGVDSGRHRGLAGGRVTRALVPAGRPGQRRLGTRCLGVRRVLRRHLRAGPDLAVRRAGRSAVLLRGRAPGRAAASGTGDAAARQAAAAGAWPVPGRAWRSCRHGRGAASGRAVRHTGQAP